MKRFLISVILLLSLSALFATEEQVFAAVDAIVKNPPATQEESEKILFENGFIPVPLKSPYGDHESHAQNYFGDTKVIASYASGLRPAIVRIIFEPPNEKEFTVTAQKILQYFTNKYKYTYRGYNKAVSYYRWDFPQKEYGIIIWYGKNECIEIHIDHY